MDKIDLSSAVLINNTQSPKKRFELKVKDQVAFIEYILAKGDVIYLVHTEVPESLEGNGLGSTLVKKTLEYIKNKGYALVPLCPFVAAYLKKHPELGKEILKEGYSI